MPTLEDEVAFLNGIDANNLVAAEAFRTWVRNSDPALYNDTSLAAKWGSATPGTGATITYWFNTSSAWNDSEKASFQAAMAIWSAVANVNFVLASDEDTANFWVTRGDDEGANWVFGSYASVPVGSSTLGTPPLSNDDGEQRLWYDPNQFGALDTGLNTKANGAMSTLIHELGHALGLGHGGPYNGDLTASQQYSAYDMTLWTIMSYAEPHEAMQYAASYPVKGTDWGTDSNGKHYEPLSPMALDILAIQQLYGKPTNGPLNGGNLIFGFNTNIGGPIRQFYDFNINQHPIVTLWTDGLHNTLDLSGYSQDAVIRLDPGSFSSAGGKINNIGIAFDTVVETGKGGHGNDKIFASDVDSFLYGNDGIDQLHGGAGNDVLSGGAGPDSIDGGGGFNILRDTLADLNGDTVFDFGQSMTIDVLGALIGHANLTVTPGTDGNATLTLGGGTQILLTGTYTDGDFMLVARGTGDAMQTSITFETFLPVLREGVSVNPDWINGVSNELFMTGDGSVSFTATLQSAISAFNNTLGYYRVAADGAISGVEILFDNTLRGGPATVGLGTPGDGEQIGFFLIQNGFGQFGALPDNLSFVTEGTLTPANAYAGLPMVLQSATLGLLDATILHSNSDLNPGSLAQVLSGVASGGTDLLLGFEDLVGGDNDFQDVVLRVHGSNDDVYIL